MNKLQGLLLIYGLLMLVLALVAASKSPASLIAGGGAGLICIGAAALAKTHPAWGYRIGGVVALAVLGRFSMSLVNEFEVYPTLVLVVASAITFLVLLGAHFAAKLKRQGEAGTESP